MVSTLLLRQCLTSVSTWFQCLESVTVKRATAAAVTPAVPAAKAQLRVATRSTSNLQTAPHPFSSRDITSLQRGCFHLVNVNWCVWCKQMTVQDRKIQQMWNIALKFPLWQFCNASPCQRCTQQNLSLFISWQSVKYNKLLNQCHQEMKTCFRG